MRLSAVYLFITFSSLNHVNELPVQKGWPSWAQLKIIWTFLERQLPSVVTNKCVKDHVCTDLGKHPCPPTLLARPWRLLSVLFSADQAAAINRPQHVISCSHTCSGGRVCKWLPSTWSFRPHDPSIGVTPRAILWGLYIQLAEGAQVWRGRTYSHVY